MMIIPENQLPPDDYDASEADDQQSQQDIHSNGLDDHPNLTDDGNYNEEDLLKQASAASEAAFTLDVDKGIAPDKEQEKEDGKTK
ncbi:MAG: hypothetical protein ACOH2A_12145 [Sphingobacteriaceae bacterium]